jgi:branched-chain amino acid transport system permease protein
MQTLAPYVMHIAIMSCIYVMLVQSLNIMLGYSGLLSLATPAFLGMGAYTAALLSLHGGWNSGVTFCCAAVVGAVTGLALGVPSLRLSRHSFVIVTLSFTLLLQLIASNWVDLTRGAMGISNIPAVRLFGWTLTDKGPWLIFVLLLSALVVLATWLIVSSRLGRAMIAVRDNEPLAVAAGIDPMKIRLFAFACSGVFAGLAGACYAHYISFIDPGVFSFWFSEPLLIMVVLGGSGTLWGPVLGAVAFTVIPELLRMAPDVRSLLYGIILLVSVLFMPRGMAAWFGRPTVTGAGVGK